jgi:hypothetical protein
MFLVFSIYTVGDLRPIDILTGERAVEVTGVVAKSPALWLFRGLPLSSEHFFYSTQAPVVIPESKS